MVKFNSARAYLVRSNSPTDTMTSLVELEWGEGDSELPRFDADRDGIGFIRISNDTDGPFWRVENVYIALVGQRVTTAPAALVKEAMQKRLKQLQEHGISPDKYERLQLREEITARILKESPNVKLRYTWVTVDTRRAIIAIGTSTGPFAEDVLGMLRALLGSLPVAPLLTDALHDFTTRATEAMLLGADLLNEKDRRLAGYRNEVIGWLALTDHESTLRNSNPESLTSALSEDLSGREFVPTVLVIGHYRLGELALTYKLDLKTGAVKSINWLDTDGRDAMIEGLGEDEPMLVAVTTVYATVELMNASLLEIYTTYS